MKKNILVGLLIFVGVLTTNAQEWLTDFNEAQKVALENSKPIVLVFSGSDWCAPCIKLEKQVLDTKEFQEYANENYVLVKADFPRRRKNQLSEALQAQNNKLAETYNKSGGFPLVVVLDETGKKLGEIGYKKVTPESYLGMLNKMIK